MSERRPPGPAPVASPSEADPLLIGDTPRDGSPAFGDTPVDGTPFGGDTDEIEVSFDAATPAADGSVPLVGPSPDHASEYVPPRPLPKPADHKTMENIPVKVSPEADPRIVQTQKAMRVLQREEAQRHLMLMGVDSSAAPDSRASQASVPNAESTDKSRTGLYIGGGIVFLILIALGAVVFKSVMGDGEVAASPTAAAGAAVTAAPAKLSTATAPKPTRTAAAEPAPTPPATTAPKAPNKRKKPPTDDTPKPINE